MILIDNENCTDPRVNLALEEYALTHLDLSQDHLLFYINEPSVIIGKHQNTHEEINAEYVKAQGIHVVRRISGGGAVYHDLGNLNFSILTLSDDKVFNDYANFTKPVIAALKELGVPAELTGRNDIVVENRKISGNAQYRRGQRMFCHGTLLFNTELDHVVAALNVKLDKIQSKGIKSVRSRVANISEFLKDQLTIHEFKQLLIQAICQHTPVYRFSQDEWQAIHQLAQEKYQSWEWNYGKSPEFNIQHRQRLSIGEIDIRMHVKHGLIQEIKIYGDFFAARDIAEIEQLLTKRPYQRELIHALFSQIALQDYFGPVSVEELLGLMF